MTKSATWLQLGCWRILRQRTGNVVNINGKWSLLWRKDVNFMQLTNDHCLYSPGQFNVIVVHFVLLQSEHFKWLQSLLRAIWLLNQGTKTTTINDGQEDSVCNCCIQFKLWISTSDMISISVLCYATVKMFDLKRKWGVFKSKRPWFWCFTLSIVAVLSNSNNPFSHLKRYKRKENFIKD